MTAHTISNISELAHHFARIQAQIELVSFDIFDTLLERHVEPPDVVKIMASRYLAMRYGEHSSIDADVILGTRNEVEAALRRSAAEQGFDHECPLSVIASEVASRLDPSRADALRHAFIECEMEAEKEALYPKQGIQDVLASFKASGKRIVAISDMYLDGALINQLLQHFGLVQYIDQVYVSADLKLAKYSGRLFRHVLDMEGVSAERMMHVGDNLQSDFRAPRALGIHAFHLRDTRNLQRRQEVYTLQWLAGRNRFWKGRHLLHMIPPAHGNDFYHRYGYDRLGPVFCGFMLGVIEEVRRRKIGKVFFLAREGYMFHLLYQKMAPFFDRNLPSGDYLYLSRKSVFLPACLQRVSRSTLNTVLCNPKQKGLQSLANALGIPPEEFDGIACRFNLATVDQPIVGWTEEQFATLLRDAEFTEIVGRHAQAAHALLREYLKQQGFFGDVPIALVDIGWSGTIQNALKEAFKDEMEFPPTVGYYMSFNAGLKYDFGPGEVKGVLYDKFSSPPDHNVFALFEELFENGARASHGTTTGYRKDAATGRVEPVLRKDDAPDRVAERAFETHVQALQKGVLEFADGFVKAARLTGYRFDEIKPALMEIAARSVVHPDKNEAEHFLNLVHAEDLGSDNVMSFSEYRLPGPRTFLRPRRLLRLLRRSNWLYGTARTLGVPGFNHLLRRVELIATDPKSRVSNCEPPCRAMQSESMLFALVRGGWFPALSRTRKLLVKIWRA